MYQQPPQRYPGYPYAGVPAAPQPKMGWLEKRKLAKQAAHPGTANFEQSAQIQQMIGANNDVTQFMRNHPEILVNLVHAFEKAMLRIQQETRKAMTTTITIPAHEGIATINGQSVTIKIPEVVATLKKDWRDPENKPSGLSVHDDEYTAALEALRPKGIVNREEDNLESEFKQMEADVMTAVPPPPYYQGQPPPQEQGIAGALGTFALDTVYKQATGVPRNPPPYSPYG